MPLTQELLPRVRPSLRPGNADLQACMNHRKPRCSGGRLRRSCRQTSARRRPGPSCRQCGMRPIRPGPKSHRWSAHASPKRVGGLLALGKLSMIPTTNEPWHDCPLHLEANPWHRISLTWIYGSRVSKLEGWSMAHYCKPTLAAVPRVVHTICMRTL